LPQQSVAGVYSRTFDRYGNRTIDVANTTDGIPKPNFSVNTANNRLGVPSGQSGTMSYDSAGNLQPIPIARQR